MKKKVHISKVHTSKLFVDKISFTAHVEGAKQAFVKKKMESLLNKGYAKKAYNGFMYRTQLYVPIDSYDTKFMLMQCHPTGGNKAFCRFEFNPCHANMLMVKKYIDFVYPGGHDALIHNGIVTRLDWALDIWGIHLSNLCIWSPKTRKVFTYSNRGRLETLNLGGEHSQVRFNCYDKQAQLKATEGIKIGACTRIEVNMKPRMTLDKVANYGNPFSLLHVSAFSALKFTPPVKNLIRLASMAVGSQTMINSFTGSHKEKLVGRVKTAQPSWWKPEKIWHEKTDALNVVRKPKGKKDFTFGFLVGP